MLDDVSSQKKLNEKMRNYEPVFAWLKISRIYISVHFVSGHGSLAQQSLLLSLSLLCTTMGNESREREMRKVKDDNYGDATSVV